MLKIGITGGIGSGKTTVCNLLKNLGIPVFNSDICARIMLDENEELKTKIKTSFDSDMYTSGGKLDRIRMANLVFNDRNELEKINKLVHPLVKDEFNKWCEENSKRPYVVKEAAILFESGAFHDLHKIVTVFCPKEIRIQRILKRDKTSREQIEKRMRFQYTDKERNEMSDFIIMNDGTEDLLPQVMELHEIFLNENNNNSPIF